MALGRGGEAGGQEVWGARLRLRTSEGRDPSGEAGRRGGARVREEQPSQRLEASGRAGERASARGEAGGRGVRPRPGGRVSGGARLWGAGSGLPRGCARLPRAGLVRPRHGGQQPQAPGGSAAQGGRGLPGRQLHLWGPQDKLTLQGPDSGGEKEGERMGTETVARRDRDSWREAGDQSGPWGAQQKPGAQGRLESL